MARPHIEFVQAQVIPWQRGLYGGSRPGTETRILSLDEDNGGTSLMIRYPSGWSRIGTEHLAVDEEFLVLDGSIEIDGQVYGRLGYGHFPRHYVRHRMSSGGGAVVMTFFSGEPKAISGTPSEPCDVRRLVRFIDALRMEGNESHRAEMFPGLKPGGALHKRLKTDPVTEEVTWIVMIRGGRIMEQNEIHPVVEEEFSLSGDQIGPRGNMRPGAYFWRPPGIQHGPFGTATGTTHLVRGIGGKYTTRLQDVPGPFPWDTPYNPILPPAYQEYVRAYADRETSY
ncbi:MAG: hypothetical protein FJX65_04455 [Alphaproteobacteria bacterium]|nr:hypothetical protein [Alphaproteobacteria bacterium]